MELTSRNSSYIFKQYIKILFVVSLSLIIYIAAAAYNYSFVKFMPEASYLTWHTVFEFASIFVSLSIFTIIYFAYEESRSLKLIMFGCAFLLMGCLDIFHTFSFKGMPYFFIANNAANRATTLWIFSRLLGSLTFLIATIIPSNSLSNIKKEIFTVTTIFFTFILFLMVTYYPNFFPQMYIEAYGLSRIKIILEYLVIIILIVSFTIIAGQYNKTKADKEYKFLLALVLLIFSEFSFTSYGSIYDAYSYIGHFFKVIAYIIFYNSIYIEHITIPYKELKRTKNKLKIYSENLDFTVKKRTKELENLNEILLNDLGYAKEMQRCLLPSQMPNNMNVSFHAEYLAAEKLSGDFYNVVKLDEENIAIYIGDVSGHGIAAAMLTVFAYQNILQLTEKAGTNEDIIEPGLVLKTIYDSFNKTNINEEKYIIMIYGIYNTKNKSFTYASAGMNVAPYLIKISGQVKELIIKGFPICKLGEFMDPSYNNTSIQLETGDKMIFYSDGLVEAQNKDNEIYGHKKLETILKDNSTLDPEELNRLIKNDLFNHIENDKELMDDITFLTMNVLK